MRSSFPIQRAGLLSLLTLCVLGVALLGLLTCTAFSSRPPTPPTWPAKCGTWSRIADTHPNPGGTQLLLGVAAVSPTQAWAVGHYVSSRFSTEGLIEHWNGSSWSATASPSPGSTWNELSAVAAISAHDAWVVGTFSSGDDPLHTLTEHWDGTRWSVVASPDPEASSFATYAAVTALAPQDAWAVGWYNVTASVSRVLIEHWDGTRWQRVPAPEVLAQSVYLLGITAVSPHDVWAVGSREDSGSQQVLIEHWDGTRWSLFPAGNALTSSELLRAAAHVPSTSAVWAVGLVSNSFFTEFYC